MGRQDLLSDGVVMLFLVRISVQYCSHVEKVNEGELGHNSRGLDQAFQKEVRMPEIARSEFRDCPAYRNPCESASSCADRFVMPVATEAAQWPQIPPAGGFARNIPSLRRASARAGEPRPL